MPIASLTPIFVKTTVHLKKTLTYYISYFILFISYIACFTSCTTVDVFEKNVTIPRQSWSSRFKPDITFDIKDTTARYKIFIVIRHTDAYRYKNIWINIHTESPSGAVHNQPLNLQLAIDSQGWIATGMDDIFEHRIQITPPDSPERLSAGTYHFQLENIMREDPLTNVMNVGIRLEKVK